MKISPLCQTPCWLFLINSVLNRICRGAGNKSEDCEKKDNISRHNYTSERVTE